MDLLSDALTMVRLSGAVLFRVNVNGSWCIKAGAGLDDLTPVLPRGTNHIIAFHVLLAGHCYLRRPPDDWILARPGDAIVLPHGDLHEVGDHPDDNPIEFRSILGGTPLTEVRDLHFDIESGPHVSLLCGFLGCDRRAFSPLFEALPPMFVTSLNENANGLVNYALDEALSDSPGSASLRVRMAELMFLETLRTFMSTLPDEASGWLAGLRDPFVGKAMRLMHESPGAEWTVESMAEHVACSRSFFAERFKAVIGETPMHYLTELRMLHAARRLRDSQNSIEAVAEEAGYASSAAFQRAFKRCFGVPPAAWRRETAHSFGPSGSARK